MKVFGKEHIKMRNEVKYRDGRSVTSCFNIKSTRSSSHSYYSFLVTKDKLYFVLDFLNGGELLKSWAEGALFLRA